MRRSSTTGRLGQRLQCALIQISELERILILVLLLESVVSFLFIQVGHLAPQTTSAWLVYLVMFLIPPLGLVLAGLTLRNPTTSADESEEMTLDQMRKTQTLDLLDRGDDDSLEMVFQPIFDLSTGLPDGVEALARFKAEPLSPPDSWFATAYRLGMGLQLEKYVIETTLRLLPQLPPSLYMCVNISPSLFMEIPMRGSLLKGMSGRLVLELTEHDSIPQGHYSIIRARIEVMRRMGIRIAVDDTGSGFASLAHVIELGPDFIKLDRSIVHAIDTDRARLALATSLAGFASNMGTQVIAEGIETSGEMLGTLAAGITLGQGFGLGRPAAFPIASRSLLHEPSLNTEVG